MSRTLIIPNSSQFLASKPLSRRKNYTYSYSTSKFSNIRIWKQKPSKINASSTSSSAAELSLSVDVLKRFIDLNSGKWNGSFYQFDGNGSILQKVWTKLAASSYGEDDLTSLIQTLYIKQSTSNTSIDGDELKPEWEEYKIKETNMFTIDKYQQIGFFPKEKAFSLRYQTARMLETVLRVGVLGEDDVGEENPKNLKIPSRRPSVVCENCLYSLQKETRARAFHIMDPQGVVDTLLVFLEDRGTDQAPPDIFTSCSFEDTGSRVTPILGRWKGHSVTNRSGVYGATIAEADTITLLEMDDKGQLIQDITSTTASGTTTNVHWTGTISNNLVNFDKGYQITLLPGGMYMGYPRDIAKSIAQSQCFHLEFGWMESLEKRQKLIRTYDVEGLAVSSTYVFETKV